MKAHSSKAFIHYLERMGRDKNVFENAKNDARLSQVEQKIIRAWNLLRTSECKKILEMTESMPQDLLIRSQMLLVRGIALHNSGAMKDSISIFEESLELMKSLDLRRMKFIAYFNLFNACQNLKWDHRLSEVFQKWLLVPVIDLNEEIAMKRCQLRMFFSLNDLTQAEEVVSWLEGHIEEMSELNRLNFHIDLFDLYVKKRDFQSCSHLLNKLKKFRSYHYGAHYKYLKSLVDYHLNDKPFYIYERDFEGNIVLFYKLSVLKFLEEKNISQATYFWDQLHDINPDLYKKGFECKGEDNLFSLALEKLLTKSASPHLDVKNKGDMTKGQLVLEILLHHSPVAKEKLYELVWGKEAGAKSDLAKLQLIIFRLNLKGDVQIKYRKGCYELIPVAKQVS
jgi:hypothetical protein